jgi:hypothetical protein
LVHNQNGKRKVVVIVRERGGNSVPAVFKSEAKAMAFLRAHVAKGDETETVSGFQRLLAAT